MGPNHLASDVAVDSGQMVHMNMSIENTGNIEIDLDVSVLPDNPQWAIQVSHDGEQDSRRIRFGPRSVKQRAQFVFGVPISGGRDSNVFTIRTERSPSNFRQNITTLVVKDELGISSRHRRTITSIPSCPTCIPTANLSFETPATPIWV